LIFTFIYRSLARCSWFMPSFIVSSHRTYAGTPSGFPFPGHRLKGDRYFWALCEYIFHSWVYCSKILFISFTLSIRRL